MGRYLLTKDGKRKFECCSRWIEIKEMVVTRNHSLWQYSDHGIDCGSCDRHPVFYFTFCHQKHAIGEFMKFGTPILPNEPIELYDYQRDVHVATLHGYNTDCGNPLYVELDSAGSYIKVYREVE